MTVLEMLVMGAYGIACLVIGARIGQKAVKGEPIELPKVNPMEIVREHRERKEAEKEQNRTEAILRNIEAYDGTGNGQKDVPGG